MADLFPTVLALIAGLTVGWHAHHRHTRATVARIHAACTGITDRQHLAAVVADYARTLHIRLGRTRRG